LFSRSRSKLVPGSAGARSACSVNRRRVTGICGAIPCRRFAGRATAALALRFLIDDFKAFYSEAAQSNGPAPASRQIDLWFWRETLAGRFVRALRTSAMRSENNALKTVGGRFFVPAHYLPA